MNKHRRLKFFIAIIILLTVVVWTKSANAQKAYDNVSYKTKIYGNSAILTLADGYLLASKMVIYSKQGDQVFATDASEAGEKGELQFSVVKGTGRYKSNKGTWIILTGLNEPELPSQIKAIYCDGKMRNVIVFNRNKMR